MKKTEVYLINAVNKVICLALISGFIACKSPSHGSGLSAIIGEDDRVDVTDPALRNSVGAFGIKITDPKTKQQTITNYCTAFAISETEVITAEHCVNKAASMVFSPFNTVNTQAPAMALTLKKEYPNADIAVLSTSQNLTAWLPTAANAPQIGSPQIEVVSFEPHSSRLLSAMTGGFVLQIKGANQTSSGYYVHSLDTTAGSSGSPVLQDGKVVAVHLGSAKVKTANKTQTLNYASSLAEKEIAQTPTGFLTSIRPECRTQGDLHDDVYNAGWQQIIWSQSLGAVENVGLFTACVASTQPAICLEAYFDYQEAQLIQKLGQYADEALTSSYVQDGVMDGRPISLTGGMINYNSCTFGIPTDAFIQFYIAYNFKADGAGNPGNPPVTVSWTKVGQAVNADRLAACTSGALYALNDDKRLYVNFKSGANDGWQYLQTPSQAQEISCIGDILYALNYDHSLWRNDGSHTDIRWTRVGQPTYASRLGGFSGQLFVLNEDNTLWNSANGADTSWRKVGTPTVANQITGAGTDLFVLNNDWSLYRSKQSGVNGSWQRIDFPKAARKIAATSSLDLWVLNADRTLWHGVVSQ